MSEQELNLRRYVIRTYLEGLLKKLDEKKNIINDATKEELEEIIDDIYNDIDMFKEETNNFKREKAK